MWTKPRASAEPRPTARCELARVPLWLLTAAVIHAFLSGCALTTPSDATDASASEEHVHHERVCPSLTIQTQTDLDAARDCSEIDGSLTIRSKTIEHITARDLPKLRRVRGSVLSVGGSRIREIELPKLREVGNPGDTEIVFEIGFDAMTLERIALPELRVVHGSLGILALGGLRELDLSQLETVDARFALGNLPRLTELNLASGVSAGDKAVFELLCRLPADGLPAAEDVLSTTRQRRDLGCCTESAEGCELARCVCD